MPVKDGSQSLKSARYSARYRRLYADMMASFQKEFGNQDNISSDEIALLWDLYSNHLMGIIKPVPVKAKMEFFENMIQKFSDIGLSAEVMEAEGYIGKVDEKEK
jgi:hypothetical protein